MQAFSSWCTSTSAIAVHCAPPLGLPLCDQYNYASPVDALVVN